MFINNINNTNKNRSSFTLIELLVVLALVAILSVVVVMTLNPAELLRQARDSNRLSDLSTINTALNLFSADVTSGFMGTSTVVYVSIPDNASSTCGSLGLPALPSGYTYNCVTTANLRNTNGTGWIPVNFQRISSNSPISQLPIDPQNTTSSGNYYTYVSGGSWILTAIPESAKQKAELSTNPHIQNYPGVIGMGNNLNLSPLYNPTGLVGYWKFDEGIGNTVKDSSGNGNNGTWNGSGGGGRWISGKVGAFGGQFNGNDDYVSGSLDRPIGSGDWTVAAWFYEKTQKLWGGVISLNSGGSTSTPFMGSRFTTTEFGINNVGLADAGIFVELGSDQYNKWIFGAITRSGNLVTVVAYEDGSITQTSGVPGWPMMDNSSFLLGRHWLGGAVLSLDGYVDDARVYDRALSAAEIAALYNATK